MVGRVFGSAKRAGFRRYNPSGKSPQALCTSKAIIDFHFLEITSLLGLLNCNRQNRQDRACRFELADLGLKYPLEKSILPLASVRWWPTVGSHTSNNIWHELALGHFNSLSQ